MSLVMISGSGEVERSDKKALRLQVLIDFLIEPIEKTELQASSSAYFKS